MQELRHFVNGKWIENDSLERSTVVDPTSGTVIATFPANDQVAVTSAVDAAARAQPAWAALSLEDRLALIERAAAALDSHVDEIAEIERREMGRPISIGKEWLRGALEGLKASIDVARDYEFVRESSDGVMTTTVVRRPVGVAAVIVPWNFQANVIVSAIGPILASGNTLVVKPSERAPMSAVGLFEHLSFPPGVVNLVLGDGRAGAALVADRRISLVNFTGSTTAGRHIAEANATHLRRSVLELGGKDAVIVDSDVDVAVVAADVARGSFVNSGQICTSMERIYVHQAIAQDFVRRLVREADRYRRGGGDALMGPLVDERQRENVARHVDDAINRGAVVETGGSIPAGPGYYYPATVLTGVTDEMLVMQEETFGPVAPVQVVASFEEALAKAQATEFGLAATIYSNNPDHIAAAGEIPVGIVWINGWQNPGKDVTLEPFGASGMTPSGHFASFDAATRPVSIVKRV
jgi:acyl-CoA reductase-like NAD-dependent aldehyde dehydrogenase